LETDKALAKVAAPPLNPKECAVQTNNPQPLTTTKPSASPTVQVKPAKKARRYSPSEEVTILPVRPQTLGTGSGKV